MRSGYKYACCWQFCSASTYARLDAAASGFGPNINMRAYYYVLWDSATVNGPFEGSVFFFVRFETLGFYCSSHSSGSLTGINKFYSEKLLLLLPLYYHYNQHTCFSCIYVHKSADRCSELCQLTSDIVHCLGYIRNTVRFRSWLYCVP
jgi:hypothetical protein